MYDRRKQRWFCLLDECYVKREYEFLKLYVRKFQIQSSLSDETSYTLGLHEIRNFEWVWQPIFLLLRTSLYVFSP